MFSAHREVLDLILESLRTKRKRSRRTRTPVTLVVRMMLDLAWSDSKVRCSTSICDEDMELARLYFKEF